MKSRNQTYIAFPFACFFGASLMALPTAQAQKLPKNGLRIPYTIELTATSQLNEEPKEWTKKGINYVKETSKFDVFRVGNKQLLEILLEEGIIKDSTIRGWALVEYLQTSGSMEDEGMFQRGIFLVKTGREPIDVNEYLGYTLTEREVESGEETYSEKNGVFSETSKYDGQCIGKIQFAGATIGSGVAGYTNTWSGTWSEYDYDYNWTWSYSPQTFSISGISGWLGGESEDDDPYGEPNVETYYPSNPEADYQSYSTYGPDASGPRLYFYNSAENVSYYGSVNFVGPFYNEQNDEPYYPSYPQGHFQSLSSVSTNGGAAVYRFYFNDSINGVSYYSNVQFEDLNYYLESYDEEADEDPVLFQGSIKMSGKGTAIRLPAQDYYPY